MKPRKLRIAGLNSFVEEQVIDFERLTQKGLFGIFGPTGSGKSTILDAITIAMYGEISRGTSEYINSQKEDLFVSYEFEIGSAQNRCIYIIDRHIKRDKSGTGYTTKQAVLRQVTDGESKILCDKAREIKNSIISIIGLNCDEFTRSVVLPQGKFSEFSKLRGSKRREMLERIFNLKKYGTDS
jgi:exonuclease SbcC